MKKIYIATTNKGKIREISDILKIPLEFAKLELDEVQNMDLEYVARKKVEEAFKILKKPVIVDDVGVYIEAWNGFPGPFAKFILDHLGNERVLEILASEKNRNLVVKSAIGYHDGKAVHVFIGEVNGTLAFEEKGTEGYGFDPIIIPEGQDLTYAQMGRARKNELSHRRKALDKLKTFLDSQKR